MRQRRILPGPLSELTSCCAAAPADDAKPLTVETWFQQPCPTCGRRMLIRIEQLGRSVACSHCGRRLLARDTSTDHGFGEWDDPLTCRADQLLAALERSA